LCRLAIPLWDRALLARSHTLWRVSLRIAALGENSLVVEFAKLALELVKNRIDRRRQLAGFGVGCDVGSLAG
jgi:hypothetical protein